MWHLVFQPTCVHPIKSRKLQCAEFNSVRVPSICGESQGRQWRPFDQSFVSQNALTLFSKGTTMVAYGSHMVPICSHHG